MLLVAPHSACPGSVLDCPEVCRSVGHLIYDVPGWTLLGKRSSVSKSGSLTSRDVTHHLPASEGGNSEVLVVLSDDVARCERLHRESS